MSRLWLKLIRDLGAYRAQVIGVMVVMTLGIAMYHSYYLSYESLGASYDVCYDKLKLADFSIEMVSAPEQTVKRLAAIPGVRHVAGRLRSEIRVEQGAGRRKVTTGRIISVPDQGLPRINKLVVLRGRYLGPPDRREVLLEHGFADAHNYKPGESIYPVVEGVRRQFSIAGIVSSPEYLYVVGSKENLFPTPDSFGVMWMRRRQLESLLDMQGMINEVCVLTEPARREQIMRAMHAELRRFGAETPMPQEDQPSRALLDEDREGLKQFAIIFPALFIGMAAMTVYSTAARTVARERQQIGFLRASGLSARRVGLQYLAFATLTGLAGALPGVLLGQYLGYLLTQFYLGTLGVPFVVMASGLRVGALGLAIALGSCALAGLRPALAAAAMTPAEAMRLEMVAGAFRKPPAVLAWLERGASFVLKVPLNNLFRQRHRTFYTVLGVAAGIMLMMSSMAMMDAMWYAIDYYFTKVRNYDVDVGFARPVSDIVIGQVENWPQVQWAEGTLGVPVKLTHGGRAHDTVISGVPPDSKLQSFRDMRGRPLRMTGEGLFPSETAARLLSLERGDLAKVEYAYNSRELRLERAVRVASRVEQPMGSGTYMPQRALARIFGSRLGIPPGTVTGMVIKAKPGYEQAVARRAYDLPDAVIVETTFEIRRQIEQQMALSYAFIGIMVLFAAVLTVAIVYNTIATNAFERRSEIASLRALGVEHNEVKWMMTIENLASAALGVIVGVPAGMLMTRGIVKLWETELFTIQCYIAPQTYVISVVFALLLVIACQVPALRYLGRMNLAQMTRLHGE